TAGADLDLGGDQLARCRLRQQGVLLRGGVEILKAVLQLERGGVEDGELLLEPDREVGGGLESLPSEVEVEGQGIRSGRSRARRGGRRRGWRCAPSPPAA